MSKSLLHDWESSIEKNKNNTEELLKIAEDIYNTAYARGKASTERPQGDLISRSALKNKFISTISVGRLEFEDIISLIDNAPTVELQIGRMTLGDMLRTLRTFQYERIEIRDDYGNEILTCPTDAEGVIAYMDYTVIEWFPRGAPNKDATFTVYVRSKEMQNES